ncbi:MAG: BMP family protein [Acidimicrobiia bacterium]|nr:BMP family protein [Acidimicrobiia bacterium]
MRSALVRAALVVVLLGGALAGCGDDDGSDGGSSGGGGGSGSFKVGMALPGPVNDKGFNEVGYLGLQAIEALGAEISYVENVKAADMVEALRNLASQDLDLVIAHGGEFSDAVIEVATEFPDVKFTVFNGTKTAPNVAAYFIRYGQGSYLAGALAARMSETGVVGYIGGAEIPPTLQGAEGFEAGAKAVRPDIEVITTVTGDFDDAPKAKEAALAQIADGADVLYSFVNAGLPGVTEAVKAADHPTKQIGYIIDHCEDDEVFLADAMFDSVTLYEQIGASVKDGTWEGDTSVFVGLENPDVVWMSYCEGRVDADAQTEIEEMGRQVVAGELDIPEGI